MRAPHPLLAFGLSEEILTAAPSWLQIGILHLRDDSPAFDDDSQLHGRHELKKEASHNRKIDADERQRTILHNSSKSLSEDPYFPYEATKDWMWYKPSRGDESGL